jgi:hypothetical protein
MKLTDEGIKELLRQRPLRATPRKTECLTEEQFLKAAMRKLGDTERRRIANHLATCTDCTDSYRVVLQLRPWAEEAERVLAPRVAPTPAASRRFSDSLAAFWQRLNRDSRVRAIAAIVLIIVAGGSLLVWQWLRQTTQPGSIERAPVLPRLSIVPTDKAAVGEPPETFSWSAVEGATGYKVVIFDFQSTTVWESGRLRETSIRLPEPVRQRLLRNRPYYWRVIAEDALEQRQSELFQFTVTGGEQR